MILDNIICVCSLIIYYATCILCDVHTNRGECGILTFSYQWGKMPKCLYCYVILG